ncbi:MAG: twin-arginine translocase subunit TatC [Lentisphaerae bacterium]|nr:twin-arginine translocase subunit TatC [Lentisphaerota bacterium]
MTPTANSTFLEHLEALRRTLLGCLASWAIALPIGFALAPAAVSRLLDWCRSGAIVRLHYFSPLDVFVVQMKTGAVLAAVLCYPYAANRLWRFLVPALHAGERKMLSLWLVASSLLFLAGGVFCVLVLLPLVMRFSATFASEQVAPMIGIGAFVSLAGTLILASGVLFQMPVWVCLAVRFGLVRIESLRASRPYALIVVLILAAVFTPPDVVSQLILAVPTWLLFELGLWVAGRMRPAVRAAPGAAGAGNEPPAGDALLPCYEQASGTSPAPADAPDAP